ncbi:centromere/kinetochore protein zw10 homolog isoform X1 [Procambarus clarkii]|uniref:centromere/kinetochore protein zw10 homolog isoform X1 n=2 Tax=Procambarus clarkii TaxID=6728 RepID=UPI003743678A
MAATLQEATTPTLQEATTPTLQEATTATLQEATTATLQEATTTNLQEATTTNLQEATTTNLQEATTTNLQEATTTNLQEATTATLQEATTATLQEATTPTLQEATTPNLQEATTPTLQRDPSGPFRGTLQDDPSEGPFRGTLQRDPSEGPFRGTLQRDPSEGARPDPWRPAPELYGGLFWRAGAADPGRRVAPGSLSLSLSRSCLSEGLTTNMSLVADVVASIRSRGGRDKSAKLGVEGQLEELVKRAEEARVGVFQALGSRYSKLTTALHDTTQLHERVGSALEEISNLHNTIEEELVNGVKGSVGEFGALVRRWREVQVGLEAAGTILNIHTLFDEAHNAQLNYGFLTTAKNLAQVELLLREASEKEVEGELEIIVTLQEELLVRRTQLAYTIGEIWCETIKWDDEHLNDGSRSVTLLIHSTGDKSSVNGLAKLQNMLGAFYLLGELQRRITGLGKNLMKHFFAPIINYGAEVKVAERSDGYTLRVTQPSGPVKKPPATMVFSNLQQVFLMLHRTLLITKVETDEENGEEVSLMQLLGKEIGEEFTELLIKECLAEAVPCNRAQLEEFEVVKRITEDFQKFLCEKGFYGAQDKSIIEYAANVDVVFSNKACAHILERARELMKRPIHDTVCITPIETNDSLIIQDETGRKLEKSTLRLEKLLAAKTFNLPKCQISASICELIELIYETMEEACNSSPQYAGRLFYTVRNILTLYCHVVPTAHAHTLATLPLQAAVVHNNSMYLAHHSLLLGHQYKNRLPVALRDNTIITVDLSQQLRKMATTTFLKAMQGHRVALIDSLRDSAGFENIGCNTSGVNKAQQGMRQVLHQLQLLHRVWQNVLPHDVYTKAIGTLVGSVVEEVVVRVVGLEDISADAALALITLLNLLKDNIPPLFQVEGDARTSPGDVIRRVRLWGKFCELIVILGASLRDILDRWADGKGPLAQEFTPDEAKQLIRALFQNTDRRAQVLARIK